MQAYHSIVMDHLDRLTDSTGLIQHAIHGIPRRESGYTTDDNARALRLCVRLWSQHPDKRMLNRVTTYLSFLEYARCAGGSFHNFQSYQRDWLDAQGGGDCQGQAVRALAEVLGSDLPEGHQAVARELIGMVLPTLADLRSLRAQAYVILAWGHLWSTGTKDTDALETIAWSAAQRLVEAYQRSSRPDWQWFEPRMTYANAVFPNALFVAARRWPKEPFFKVAEASFAYLDRATTFENVFTPIGNNGWYAHGEEKALYDQQPIEAATMAEAAFAGFGLRQEESYLASYRRAHGWFQGQNSLNLPLVDKQHGACCDGLLSSGVNRNQGAESTLAYLWTEVQNRDVLLALDGKSQAEIASA